MQARGMRLQGTIQVRERVGCTILWRAQAAWDGQISPEAEEEMANDLYGDQLLELCHVLSEECHKHAILQGAHVLRNGEMEKEDMPSCDVYQVPIL